MTTLGWRTDVPQFPFVSSPSTALQALRINFGLWPKSRHPSAPRPARGASRLRSMRTDSGMATSATGRNPPCLDQHFGEVELRRTREDLRQQQLGRAHG